MTSSTSSLDRPADPPVRGRQWLAWPSPLRGAEHRPVLEGSALPPSLFGLVLQSGRSDQLWIAILTIAVVVLDTVPIEVQRRIVNAITHGHEFGPVLQLAFAYAGLVVLQGFLKLLLNIYRSWISENSVRSLRSFIHHSGDAILSTENAARRKGVEISMIVAEADPVGGFIGTSISAPLQQIGILVAVLGYLAYLDPLMALLSFLLFSPQLILVPLIQMAINRRVQKRISVLRSASAAMVGEEPERQEAPEQQEARFEKVFRVNMGIFKLKFSLNFLMNLTHHLGIATVLGLGGWYVVDGRIEVGTVVAFVSGLSTIHDPWGDLVTWYQDLMVTSAKYELITTAVGRPKP
jgi:ABC-type multidrug transport system fused ATPase/permease subunit